MTEERSAKQGGLSLTTLAISSASAVVAATTVPLFWEKGTVIATAVMPIVTALAAEFLSRPVDKIATVGVWRQTATGTAIRERVAAPPTEVVETHALDAGRVAVPPVPADEPERRRRLNGRLVRLGLVTGVLAFVIAAAVVTVSELAIFGNSVSRDERTTLFGGKPKEQPAPAADEDAEEQDPAATPTSTPEATATPTATPEGTPTPAATPTPAPTIDATPAPTP